MRKHVKALDGVRGIAILAVLMVHFFANFTPTNLFEQILVKVSGRGNLGVDLFFVLSGFLITGILVASKDKDPHFFKNFYMRRTLRIFPLYYGVLFVIFGIVPFIPWFQGETLRSMQDQQLWAWLYGINILVALEGSWTPPYISHFWSLAVEEHFYFIWPLAVYFLSRKSLIRFSLGVIVLSTLASVYLGWRGVNELALYTLTPLRMSGLCLGGLLAITMNDRSTRTALQLFLSSVAIKGLILITAGLKPEWHHMLEPARTFSWEIFFGSLVLAAWVLPENSWLGRGLTIRPLLILGKYSYGLYVFHHFLSWGSDANGGLAWFVERLPHHSLAVLLHGALGIAASMLLAWLSFHLYEKHFLRFKVKFESRG